MVVIHVEPEGVSMPTVRCPKCRQSLETDVSLAGQEDTCPVCGMTFQVPAAARRKLLPAGLCIIAGVVGLSMLLGLLLAPIGRDNPDTNASLWPGPAEPTGAKEPPPDQAPRPPSQARHDTSNAVADVRAAEMDGSHGPEGSPPAASEEEAIPLSSQELYRACSPAVVKINLLDEDGDVTGVGSGFLVSGDGLVVTNYHVIVGNYRASAELTSGGSIEVMGVAAADKGADLVLLKLKSRGRPYPYLKLSTDTLPEPGTEIFVIGSPLGLKNSFSRGDISAHRPARMLEDEYDDDLVLIQMTADVSPGSSGCPMLAADGQVVGVVVALLSARAAAPNLNFAIPVSRARALLALKREMRPLSSFAETDESEDLETHLAAARRTARLGDWDAASAALMQLAAGYEDIAEVWVSLAFVSVDRGDYDRASHAAARAVQIDAALASGHLWAHRDRPPATVCRPHKVTEWYSPWQ